VPDAPLIAALVSCARRGVETVLILPARNDSWAVGAISRAHYPELLAAGVRIFEFRGGLLHAKTLVPDRRVALIGSANMDRRSIDRIFENSRCSARRRGREIRDRQANICTMPPRSCRQPRRRTIPRRLWQNALTMFSPVL